MADDENNGDGKTPLQKEKGAKLADLAGQGKEDTTGAPRKKRKYKKRIKKQPEPVDPVQVGNEAKFFLDFLDLCRSWIGIEKKIPENHKVMFESGYYQITVKYGAVFSQYMPELMFGGSLILIGFDTFMEAKALKAKKKEELDRVEIQSEVIKHEKETAETNEADFVEMPTIPDGQPLEPSMSLGGANAAPEITG